MTVEIPGTLKLTRHLVRHGTYCDVHVFEIKSDNNDGGDECAIPFTIDSWHCELVRKGAK